MSLNLLQADLRRIYDKALYRDKKSRRYTDFAAVPLRKIKRKNRKINVLEDRKKQFRRLTDPQFSRQLRAEFLPYTAQAYSYYSIVGAISAYLRAHLNDRSVAASLAGRRAEDAIVAGAKDNEREKPFIDYYKAVVAEAADGGRHLRIAANEVQVNLAPITFNVRCRLDENTAPVLQQKLKALFGDFTLPTRYQRDEATGQLKITTSDYTTKLRKLSFFQSLRFPRDEAPGYYQPEKLTLDRNFPKQLIDATSIEVKLHNAVMDDHRISMSEQAGAIRNFSINLTFRVMGVVTFPLEYALWATNATDLTEFVPKVFREHFDTMGLIATGKTKATYRELYARTMHIGTVKKLNDQRIKDYSITVRPRTNKENFTILVDGTVYYVPPVDQADFYVDTLRRSYDPESAIIKRNSELREIHNIPLLSDWINDAFAYTDDNGKPTSKRLIGSVPLDDVTIFRWVNQTLPEITEKIKMLLQIGDKVCNTLGLYDTSSDPELNVARSYAGLATYLMRGWPGLNYRQLVREAAGRLPPGQANEIDSPRDRKLVMEFVRLNTEISKRLMDSKDYAISTKCDIIFYFFVLGQYAQQGEKLYENYLKAMETNRPITDDMIPTKFKIPNLPGLKTVLPHQGGSLAQSQKSPKSMVMEVDAGGGKTFMTMADIIIQLEKGTIKRPLVICPGGLVKEWTSEANRASQGKINIIPITSEVIKRMVKHLGYDRHRYLQYLQKAPINTIYVCSLNFLKATVDYFTGENVGNLMQFGENYIRFFPMVQLLRQLNPDYIALDESHYAKNAKALRTEAMFSLSPISEFRRVASGTMMTNDPTDNVSQYGLLNPAIFGTREHYLEQFGIEQNGKFVELQSGAEQRMAVARAPYVVRVNKARRDWAHLLPIIRQSVIPVDMTPLQREFYAMILSKELSEIRNDPKIRKLIEKGDEKAQERLEKLLDKKLNVVEQFVNAPDANPAFVNWSGRDIKRADLISPKVRAVNALVRQHLEGGRMDNATGQRSAPDPNKIIVFCINRAASRHIYTHLERQDIAIHYAKFNPIPMPGQKTAGSSEEILLRFRQDPKIRIIIADETSLREGLNLQLASRVIFVQSQLAPGAREQAMSRALRPDVENIYKREFITINDLVTNQSFEVGKAARLIAKYVTTFKVREAENPKWLQHIRDSAVPSLELIRLNLDLLEKFTTPDHPEVREYFDAQRTINDWEEIQFKETRSYYTRMFAKLLNKSPDQIDLRRDARFVLDGSGTLAGSKSIFVPLVAGANPVDNRGLNLKPLAVLARGDVEDDDDDNEQDEADEDEQDEAEEEDIVTFEEGDLVQTEYGFGYIRAAYEGGTAILKRGVRVVIPGFNKDYPIAFSRTAVFKPVSPSADETSAEHRQWLNNLNQLKKDMKRAGKKGITFVEGYVGPTIRTEVPEEELTTRKERPKLPAHPAAKPPPERPRIKIIRDTRDEPDEEPPEPRKPRKVLQHLPKTPKQSDKRAPKFDVDAAIINGLPALVVYTDEEGTHLESLDENHGTWYPVPPFMNAHVQTYQGALNLVNQIKHAFPGSSDEQLNGILALAKKMRGSTSNTLRIRRTAISHRDIVNFMKMSHVPHSDKTRLKLYPYIYNDEMFVAAAIPNQPKQAAKLRTLTIRGVSKFERADPMAWHFGKNVDTLKRFLRKLVDNGVRINGYNDAVAKLDSPVAKRLSGYEVLR